MFPSLVVGEGGVQRHTMFGRTPTMSTIHPTATKSLHRGK
jgi:hypothetical protein